MPHLHMEYTANLPQLNADVALIRLNNTLVGSGQFAAEFDIKSRAVKVETFKVGTAMGERAFVHVKLALLSGRSPQIKKQLGQPAGGVAGSVRVASRGRSAVVRGVARYRPRFLHQDCRRRVGLRPLPAHCTL